MTKAPQTPNSRAKALAAMTKPELIKTIKALDKRQTALLNEISAKDKLSRDDLTEANMLKVAEETYGEHVTPPPPAFPWNAS